MKYEAMREASAQRDLERWEREDHHLRRPGGKAPLAMHKNSNSVHYDVITNADRGRGGGSQGQDGVCASLRLVIRGALREDWRCYSFVGSFPKLPCCQSARLRRDLVLLSPTADAYAARSTLSGYSESALSARHRQAAATTSGRNPHGPPPSTSRAGSRLSLPPLPLASPQSTARQPDTPSMNGGAEPRAVTTARSVGGESYRSRRDGGGGGGGGGAGSALSAGSHRRYQRPAPLEAGDGGGGGGGGGGSVLSHQSLQAHDAATGGGGGKPRAGAESMLSARSARSSVWTATSSLRSPSEVAESIMMREYYAQQHGGQRHTPRSVISIAE